VTSSKILTLLAINPLFGIGVIGPDRSLRIGINLLPPLSIVYDTDKFVDMTMVTAYRDILLVCLEFFSYFEEKDYLREFCKSPEIAASLFNLIVTNPAGRDGLTLVLLILWRDDFLRKLVVRFLLCCRLKEKENSRLRDYSVISFLSIFDEPILPSSTQLLNLEGMKEKIEETLKEICLLYGNSPVGRKAKTQIDKLKMMNSVSILNSNESDGSEMSDFLSNSISNLHHPRSFVGCCGAIDRLVKRLKCDSIYCHFAIEIASHLVGIETPDFVWNVIICIKNNTLTLLTKLIPFDSLLSFLIFDNHPNHILGSVALFVKNLELPTNQVNRQYCLKAVQRDNRILCSIVLKLAKSEVVSVLRLLMKFVKVVTTDPTETGMIITQSLTSILREQVDGRTFLRLSTAFVKADGFMKWLKANQTIAAPWTERCFYLASESSEFRETIGFIHYWSILGINSIQMPRVTKFAMMSLTSNRHREIILENIRILYRTSGHYVTAIPWDSSWGNSKSTLKGNTFDWPMNECFKEMTGRIYHGN
jgi:hypothetical protein